MGWNIIIGILSDKTQLTNIDSAYSELFGQNYQTKQDVGAEKIQSQIHQSKEIPFILQDYYIDNKQEPKGELCDKACPFKKDHHKNLQHTLKNYRKTKGKNKFIFKK